MLRNQIRLEPASRPIGEHSSFWRRWWPVVVPGAAVVAFASVISLQQIELRRLEVETAARSMAAEPDTGDAVHNPDLAASPGSVLDERAELERLRAQVAELRASLAARDTLSAEAAGLTAELAAAQAALPPETQQLAEFHARAQRIRCVNNMKQLGLAVRIFASDHNDDFPSDLKSIVPLVGDGTMFICPSDPARKVPTAGTSTDVLAANPSYEFVAPGPGAFETEPNRVCFVCPIHHNVTLCDGSVQMLTAERFAQLARRDGKLYLDGTAIVTPNAKP